MNSDEVDNWTNILQDPVKTWNVVRNKLKQRLIILQVKQWILAPEGVVLKRFKNEWWIDRISNEFRDPMMFQIKRMRIANSKLNKHMRGGLARRCKSCDRDVDETIDHFLLECIKYKDDRDL